MHTVRARGFNPLLQPTGSSPFLRTFLRAKGVKFVSKRSRTGSEDTYEKLQWQIKEKTNQVEGEKEKDTERERERKREGGGNTFERSAHPVCLPSGYLGWQSLS